MKKIILLLFIGLSCSLFAQETMKTKLKPLLENHLKTEPLYRNCVVSDITITNISILDEKEKNKSLFDFYHAYRLKQIDQIGFIKGKAGFIEQHCADNKELFKKYADEINAAMRETVPLIDSLWVIEDRYKTSPVSSPTTEYYSVTFTFGYTLNGSKVTETNHRILLSSQLEVLHHDFLNR